MRHGKKFNHLSRTSSHRRAMLANMASSLIKHKRVSTTVAKAKALRSYVEPLLTKSKNDTTHSRRIVFSYLQDKDTVTELYGVVAGKIANRPGGYTRIIKTGNRLGDNADMCIIELVDFNENLLKETTDKSKTRRSRRGGSKKAADAPAKEEKVEAKKEAPKKEEPKAEKKEAAVKAEAPAVEEAAPAKEEAKTEEKEVKAEAPAKEEKKEEKKEEPKKDENKDSDK